MKRTRKFAAFVASILAVACMAAPMATSFSAEAASIEITGLSASQAHTFEVYQVFTGDLSTGNVLSNMKWGSGVSAYGGTTVTPGAAVDAATVAELTGLTNPKGSDIVGKFTLSTTKACDDVTSSGESATISGLANGYYIVKDVTDLGNKDDANSSWIVQVAGTAEIAIKNAKPTVDKQVLDEEADAEAGATKGWGESADHAINEPFQFKLIATIPGDSDLAAYETFKLVFNDTMSDGVTFDSIASVSVAGTPITTNDYSETASTASKKDGLTWSLTIDDVKTKLPTGVKLGENEIKVEVVYNAHLNENAILHNATATDTDTNKNTVYLTYSNNPDSTGTGTTDGKTTEDTVWVFTYKVDNTKYKDSVSDANKLEGAVFNLKDGSEAVKFTWNDIKKAYVVDPDGSADLTSQSDGTFNIIGLDAGTYTLEETVTPAGYNTCADIEIVISATHTENGAGTAANLTLESATKNMSNEIINKSGSSLPSTGGIGTTIFYAGGGALVVGAGVLLIAKKRMSNK